MTTFAKAYAACFVAMLLADAVWLNVMLSRFYQPRIGHLMAASPNLLPAVIFYFLYILGLVVLVVLPSRERNDVYFKTLLFGVLYGLVAYATYDLTNQATLKDWPLSVTLVDIAWGASLTGVVSLVSLFAIKRRS